MTSLTTRSCSAEDVARLVAHLSTDRNAAGFVPLIQNRTVTPWCATVEGRAALGALSTDLTVLGSGAGARHALPLTGRRRFLVREARAFWRDSTGDERSFRLLESYIVDAREGRLRDRTITLLDDANGMRVRDGTKRAIAIYETSLDDLALPVFILRP